MSRSVLLITICCLLGNLVFSQSQPKISDRLNEMILNSNQSEFEAIIILDDELDLKSLDAEFRKNRPSIQHRIQKMIPLMKSHAKETQRELLEFITRDLGIAKEKIQPVWIANVVAVTASAEDLISIAQRSEVRIVEWNSPTFVEEHSCETPAISEAALAAEPNEREQGLTVINAPAMWALGYTGAGTTVFSTDTGIEAFHPTYVNRWRGLYQDQSISWYNGAGQNSLPVQCGDHGMHTLGTAIGLDRFTKDTIGVAFNANWIGAATLCGGNQTTNLGALQWALDPDNDLSTVDDMPTVLNNSWFIPSVEGQDCESLYVNALLALEMAGVTVIFSAGNSGSEPSTITAPKNINITEVNCFAVGNLDGYSANLTVNPGSSRGPSICGGDSSILIKPEVAAPGTTVRSAELGRTYGTKSGTSMAAPHVSGAVCLLKEAFPNLFSEDLKLALYLSARDLGPVGEDNAYGRGLIDVKAAYDYLIEQGNTPVPPAEGLDLIGVDTDMQKGYCGNEIELSYKLMNGGNEAIQSFDYTMRLESKNGSLVLESTKNWTGTLAINEIIDLKFNIEEPPSGDFIVKFNCNSPNGLSDAKPFNNAVGNVINIENSPQVELSINGAVDPSICSGTSVLLSAALETQEEYTVEWYSDFANNFLLHRGKDFATEKLTEDFEYFAKAFILTLGGEVIPASGEYTSNNGLKFSVAQTTKLTSVDVFAESPGTRLFKIVNSAGEDAASKVTPINIGLNTVFFDATLDPGSYTMQFLIPKPLLSKVGDVNYPYQVGPNIVITGALEEGTYPYFFNWTVEKPYECEAIYGQVEVEGVSESELDFSVNNEEQVFVDEAFTVENLSTGATQYNWLLDGEVAFIDVENPEFTLTENGLHTITCIGINNSGCEVSLSKTVLALLATSISTIDPNLVFTIFPNPTKNVLNINFTSSLKGPYYFELWDGLGRRVAVQNGLVSNNSYQLTTNELSSGLYYAQLKNASGQLVAVEKIFKL